MPTGAYGSCGSYPDRLWLRGSPAQGGSRLLRGHRAACRGAAVARRAFGGAQCRHVRTTRPPTPARPSTSSRGTHRAGQTASGASADTAAAARGTRLAAHGATGPGRGPRRSPAGLDTVPVLHGHAKTRSPRRRHGRHADGPHQRLPGLDRAVAAVGIPNLGGGPPVGHVTDGPFQSAAELPDDGD